MNWRNASWDRPKDEQMVLGYWKPNTVHKEPIFESLTFRAADDPDRDDSWWSWNDEKADEPDYWTELPEGPK